MWITEKSGCLSGITSSGTIQPALIQKMIRDQNKKSEDKIRELQSFIQRFSANKSKSKQARQEKLLDKLTVEELPASSRRYPFVGYKMGPGAGKEILTVEGISKTLDGAQVLERRILPGK
jgi:ATPase subunit of ABC transporter with duplicated ATPase domains